MTPIQRGQKKKAFQRHLRFSKLHAWGLTHFKKVILIDSDMVVLRNIDHLFLQPDLSAVEDPGAPGKFNSGLMVISPNEETLASMLKVRGYSTVWSHFRVMVGSEVGGAF